MMQPRQTLGRYCGRFAAIGAVLLVTMTGTGAAQGHGGAGGTMGNWGAFGGWMILWPVVLIGLLALLVLWTGSRPGSERPDRALEELRERYARGDLSDDEFERRRRNLRT
ncbi:SHOCT domain-containing protein [Natronoglomus mannanivorans]|uniref:SHOCT domain-containing protein n=1 Tax=Natronoglomus mannanivorans TaxID=2979990 RepID=A0AAP3E498_9EURY|nr:SHOCT domain-containing protein [Halobacteria archaeon AArc-xg1-1]